MVDRLVVVTGATSGIGRATARAFRERGARVVGTGRDQDRLAALAPQVDLALTMDVTDPLSVQVGVAAVLDGLGVPDVLVNNAGVGLFADWEHTSEGDLERLLAVNLVGAVRVARGFLPAMVERGSGVLINVASVAGLQGYPRQTAYCATKHGLLGWARALSEELRGTGVRVVNPCPPAVDTPFFERAGLSDVQARHPWVKPMSPGSVAAAIVAAALSGDGEQVLGLRAQVRWAVSRVAPGLPARLRALRGQMSRGRS